MLRLWLCRIGGLFIQWSKQVGGTHVIMGLHSCWTSAEPCDSWGTEGRVESWAKCWVISSRARWLWERDMAEDRK